MPGESLSSYGQPQGWIHCRRPMDESSDNLPGLRAILARISFRAVLPLWNRLAPIRALASQGALSVLVNVSNGSKQCQTINTANGAMPPWKRPYGRPAYLAYSAEGDVTTRPVAQIAKSGDTIAAFQCSIACATIPSPRHRSTYYLDASPLLVLVNVSNGSKENGIS